MKIIIDTDDISILAKDGANFVFDQNSEAELIKLLDIYDKMGEMIDTVKTKIKNDGLKLNSEFSGVRGDSIKVSYQAFGALYKVSDPSKADKKFINTKVSYTVNSSEVDNYIKDNGSVPVGISHNDRTKSISIKRI